MIIYRKDSHGNTRYLNVIANGSSIIQRSGMVGTANEVEHTKVAKPKNVGKANATTAEQQAVLEVNSIIASKLQEGYFLTEKEAEDNTVQLPMLAKSYKDEAHKIDWNNCFVQPKLDGMRCLAHIYADGRVPKLISRDGRIIENMEHIQKELLQITPQDIILDGELYAHGLGFQDNMKLIKKYRKGETENVKYHVYDIVDPDLLYSERKDKLENILK